MTYLEKILTKEHSKILPGLFLFSFGVWVFCFWGFLCGKLSLSSDAIAYYEHFKFYLDQMGRGVYPLWDPSRDWGSPMEFFLRRIGSFNPFIFTPLLLNKVGIPYAQAYLTFLALYYFLGMIGFYKVAKFILRDEMAAFAAYLLLMFSSLGTRLFDSYLLFTCVPLVWFFYFFITFSHKQEKYQFLGLIFTLMILLTTYIPFYFAIILLTFIGCFAGVYFKDFKAMLSRSIEFVKRNALLVLLCTIVVGVSIVPGLQFCQATSKGEVVLPERHGGSTQVNEVSVSLETVTGWGIEEDLMYSTGFSDLRKFKFAIVYVPIFAYIIFILGLFVATNRRIVFLFLWGGLLFLMFSHRGPFYRILYDHIFFFKYFRNLHFFLWFILLPIFILLITEQLRVLLNLSLETIRKKKKVLVGLLIVHGGFIFSAYWQNDAILTTYLAVILSLIFFVGSRYFKFSRTFSLVVLSAAIIIQPLETYHYLQKNSLLAQSEGYRYDRPYRQFLDLLWKKDVSGKPIDYDQLQSYLQSTPNSKRSFRQNYMAIKSFDDFSRNIYPTIFDFYIGNYVRLYDQVQWLPEKVVDYSKVERVIAENQNVAFISSEKPEPQFFEQLQKTSPTAEVITRDSSDVELLASDMNYFKVKTHFDRPRFFVYNDNFYKGWQAFINDQPVKLWRANLSFKGVLVPEGDNIVYFKFGTPGQYFLNYFLLIVFHVMFFSLLFLWFKSSQKRPTFSPGNV